MKLRKSILFLLGFLVVILAVGCGGFTEDVQKDVTTASVSETTQETSTAIPTPTAKVTATPAPTTDIGQAIQAGNEPIPTMPEQEAAVDSMEIRRQEVIAYEKERDGYSPSEQGSRGINEPCGYCGVTDVYISREGACAICYDKYLQQEFGWCEICGTPLTMLQSDYKRCWDCMKCQYCGTNLSGYINYDTGSLDTPDGTWTCDECFKINSLPKACDRCGKTFEESWDIVECGVYDNLPYNYICSMCSQWSCHNCGFYSEDIDAAYEGGVSVFPDCGLCTNCYEDIYGEPYLQACSICGKLVHPSGRINGICQICSEAMNVQTEF